MKNKNIVLSISTCFFLFYPSFSSSDFYKGILFIFWNKAGPGGNLIPEEYYWACATVSEDAAHKQRKFLKGSYKPVFIYLQLCTVQAWWDGSKKLAAHREENIRLGFMKQKLLPSSHVSMPLLKLREISKVFFDMEIIWTQCLEFFLFLLHHPYLCVDWSAEDQDQTET